MKHLIIIFSLCLIGASLSAQLRGDPELVGVIDASADTSIMVVETRDYTYAYTVSYTGLNATDGYVKVMHSHYADSLFTLREYSPTDSLQLGAASGVGDFIGINSFKKYIKYVYNSGSNTTGTVRIYRELTVK